VRRESTLRRESTPLLDRADAVWSNLLLRQMFMLLPVGLDVAFQAGAGTLDDLGPWYPLGVAVVALAVAIAALDEQAGRRLTGVAHLLPVLNFAAIGLLRLVPEPNGLGLLVVFPAMWLGIDLRGRGVALTAVYTSLLVCLPVLLYADPTVLLVGRYVQILAMAVLVSLSMAITSRAWQRRDADAAAQQQVVSDLLEAERATRALTGAIVEAVDVGLVSLEKDGTYRSMNPRHAEFMALAYPEGHEGRAGQLGWVFAADGETLLSHDEMPTIRAHRGEDFHDYLIWVGEDPEHRRALAISARHIEGDGSSRSGQVLVYKDVTDLVGALRVKDEFLASVSHELRTPLTSIMGYIDLTLLDESLSPQARRQLDVARKNTGRLLRLVNDLLFTAQTDQGRLALDRTLVDLAAIVRDSVEEVSERARGSDVRLEVTLPEVGWVEGDPLRLSQVVDNLLTNAIKYSLPGGLVEVSVAVEPAVADEPAVMTLTVTDEGIGITEEDQERLFTRFFRAAEAQERAIQGAGLGLSICKSLVEAHGGTIGVDSVAGKGTTFRVRLPVALTELDADPAR
jgi:two-component system phosphate regulon sensor histidine kinase PhoR